MVQPNINAQSSRVMFDFISSHMENKLDWLEDFDTPLINACQYDCWQLKVVLGVNSLCTLTKVRVTCMRVCTHARAHTLTHTHIMRTAAVTAQ